MPCWAPNCELYQNLWEMGAFPKLNVHYSSNQKGEFCIYTENRKAIRKYVTKFKFFKTFQIGRSASHKLFIQQLFSFLSVLKKDYYFKLLLFLNWKVTDIDVFVDKLPNTNGTWLYEIIRIINVNFFPVVIMMLQLTSYKFCRLISIRFFNELVKRIW